MFSYEEKRKIASAVESVIREINHPEMDNDHIEFRLVVYGKSAWSWADISENRPDQKPDNPWNEHAREILEPKKVQD